MNDNAFEMAAAAIRFGVGVTREVGCDLTGSETTGSKKRWSHGNGSD
jgi:hypothetical protein